MKTKCECEVCGEAFLSDDVEANTCDLCEPADTWGDEERLSKEDRAGLTFKMVC